MNMWAASARSASEPETMPPTTSASMKTKVISAASPTRRRLRAVARSLRDNARGRGVSVGHGVS